MYPYLKYLEEYLREVKDLQVLGEGADILGARMQRKALQTRRNQYVTLADEATIRRKEKLFKVVADPVNETLEYRQKRMVRRYNMRIPFTRKFLILWLDSLFGEDLYELEIFYEEYRLRIAMLEFQEKLFLEMLAALRVIRPAHIVLELGAKQEMEGTIRVAGAVIVRTRLQCRLTPTDPPAAHGGMMLAGSALIHTKIIVKGVDGFE